MRRAGPRLLVGVVGLLLVLTAFAPRPAPDAGGAAAFLAYLDENFSVWFNVLAVFAFVLGAGSLVSAHGRRVRRRERDWPYSLVTLATFVIVLVAGLAKLGGPPGLQGDPADRASWLGTIFAAVVAPLQASIFSLLAFFVASASYRAFRVRSREATALLAAALVVLLGRTPFGLALTSWLPDSLGFLRLENLSVWIIKVPNTAGQRAIMIGIALGVITMSLRLILGLERGPLGRGEERG